MNPEAEREQHLQGTIVEEDGWLLLVLALPPSAYTLRAIARHGFQKADAPQAWIRRKSPGSILSARAILGTASEEAGRA